MGSFLWALADCLPPPQARGRKSWTQTLSASSAEGWVRGHGQVWCGAESTVQGVQRTWVRSPVGHLTHCDFS